MLKIKVNTSAKEEIKDITGAVIEAVQKSGIEDGLLFLHCPHTTCAIGINENADRDVKKDILTAYSDIVKEDLPYQHCEGNSTAHIKTLMTGVSLTVFIEQGRPVFGTWQGIYLCEFDGPRSREVWLKFTGDKRK